MVCRAVEILSLTLQPLVVISVTIVVLLIVYIALAIKVNLLPAKVMAVYGTKEMWASLRPLWVFLRQDKAGKSKHTAKGNVTHF